MRRLRRGARGWMLVVAGLVGLGSAAARAVTIEFDPSQATLSAGGTLALDLRAGGLGGTPQSVIGSFDLFLSWDPAVLQLDAATLGSALGAIPAEAVASVSPGLDSVELFETSLLDPSALVALQNGTVVLSSLAWSVLDAQASHVDVIGLVSDGLGNRLASEFGSAELPAVPEPTAWIVFVVGAALVSSATGQLRGGPRRTRGRARGGQAVSQGS